MNKRHNRSLKQQGRFVLVVKQYLTNLVCIFYRSLVTDVDVDMNLGAHKMHASATATSLE